MHRAVISFLYIGSSQFSARMQRKIQLCKNVMDCLAKVAAGYSVWRGKLGLELSRARLAAAQRDLARGDTRVTREAVDKVGADYRFMVMYLAYQQAKLGSR